jgi:antitoxin HigA-1
MARIPPPHPGETLLEDFMKPLGLTANRVATDLRVPATRIGEIIHGRRAISAETALRLGRYFGTSPQFWMNLQTLYDLATAEDTSGPTVAHDVRPLKTA